MKQVYLVMSTEELESGEFTEPCRAFATRQEAEEFKKVLEELFGEKLEELFRENQHFENPTAFFIKAIPFGVVEEAV